MQLNYTKIELKISWKTKWNYRHSHIGPNKLEDSNDRALIPTL